MQVIKIIEILVIGCTALPVRLVIVKQEFVCFCELPVQLAIVGNIGSYTFFIQRIYRPETIRMGIAPAGVSYQRKVVGIPLRDIDSGNA